MSETPKHYQVLQQLRLLAQRVKAQSADYSDLEVLVSPPQIPGRPYFIDISKGRVSRRVSVDAHMLQNMQSGLVDAQLSRELRATMMAVARLGIRRK